MARSTAKAASQSSFKGDEKIVVLCGKEDFLRSQLMRQLREAIADTSGGDVETLRFDGTSATLADVLDEARSMGLMQQHKLVIVDDADEFVKRYREPLERYAASPEESATLVLRSETWHAGNLDKAIAKVGGVIKCEQFKPPEAQKWLMTDAAPRHGVKLTPPAAALLIEHMGTDLGRLDTELGKLAVSLPVGATIQPAQVEAIVGRSSEEAAWEIQSALLSGDGAQIMAKIEELIELARQPEIVVMFAVSDMMRKLHHAAAMSAERANDFVICKELRVWPRERQGPFLKAAKKLGVAKTAKLLAAIVDADRRSKSGLGDFRLNLERFCVQFVDALR